MFSCNNGYSSNIGPQGPQGTQGTQGIQGIVGPTGALPSPSLNAAIPYEPWNLDNTNSNFIMNSQDIYAVQFFAPSTANYTNITLFVDASNSSNFSGYIAAGIYENVRIL